MTTPPTTITSVHHKTPMQAWQIEGNQDIWTVMAILAGIGYTTTIQCTPPSGAYGIILSKKDFPDQRAGVGDWIVWDAETATIYASAQAAQLFTVGA